MPSVEIRAFVFSDIVGSTRLKKEMPGRDNAQRNSRFTEQILRPHRELIESALGDYEGRLISTQGDGHFLEFRSPIQAVMWAIDVQQRHAQTPIATPDGGRLGVKIGIHMGPASADPHQTGNYIGTSVDYTARLVQLATDGKIIVSEVVATFLREEEILGLRLFEHGMHELPGIGRKLVFEVLYGEQSPGPLRLTDGATPAGPSAPQAVPGPSGSVGLPPAATIMHEPRAGLRIKDYELLEEIGEGGMGKVFKARHVGMGRICVLKLIKDSLLQPGNDEIVERFYREIQVVARLKHPNIIQAYHSSSRDDDYHFLVMEYVEGTTLDRLITGRGRLPMAEACDYVRQAAEGLQCIHEHALVHRDIKPSNLLVASETGGSVVKILDLGLALLVDDGTGRITEFRERAMGTAYYMAPEQWASTTVDIRADIYALGCTFYHMLAGQPPFKQSKFSQEHAHRHAEVAPPEVQGQVPVAVWATIQKMLRKIPAERFREPAEVAAALDAVLKSSAFATHPPAPGAASSRQGGAALPEPASARGGLHGAITHVDVATDTTPTGQSDNRGAVSRRNLITAAAVLLVFAVASLVAGRMAGARRQRVVDSPEYAAAAGHFLLTLPGMNGEWWFDEVPWFFPQIRQHLLDQLTVAQFDQLQARARQPDVDDFYRELLAMCEASLRAEEAGVPLVSDQLIRRFELLKASRPFDEVDAQNREESLWGQVDSLLMLERGDEEKLTAADLHLRALLHWKMRSGDAADWFRKARGRYHTDSKELKALCIADNAVMQQLDRRWLQAGIGFESARKTVPQPNLAPELMIFAYAMEAEVRLFDTSNPRGDIPQLFAEARAGGRSESLDADHPLWALLLSREALYYLETWQLRLAEAKGEEANAKFARLPGRRRTANLYFRSRQFIALAYHFLGKAEEARSELEGLLSHIDQLLESDEIADQAKPSWQRLRPNLLGRLADTMLFGQGEAALAAATLEEAANEARRFEGGPKAPFLARIGYKAAIAHALADDAASAQRHFDAATEIAKLFPRDEQRAVFEVFQQVSAALLMAPPERPAALLAVLQQVTQAAEQSGGRTSRDDMQLLLFACDYLLRPTGEEGGVLDQQRDYVARQRARLAAPLKEDGAQYLQRIEAAARKLGG